ncbi:hypothetical protein D3C85_1586420 [compost metagenome]
MRKVVAGVIELGTDIVPVDVQFIRKNLTQRCECPLADFCLGDFEYNAVVWLYHHPGIQLHR